jgi:hypothetical protein
VVGHHLPTTWVFAINWFLVERSVVKCLLAMESIHKVCGYTL